MSNADRYYLVHGTFSLGGGYIIGDNTQSAEHVEVSPGKEWRSQSKGQTLEVIASLNAAEVNGTEFLLPAPMTPIQYAQRMTGLATARKQMLNVAKETRALSPRDGQILRDYTIRYMVVEEVDNEGDECGYCADLFADQEPLSITHQVYAVPHASYESQTTWGTCVRCALPSIDEVEDIDPSFTVLIEKVQH